MAYFDSPKKRAMWEKEMAVLRSEREYRKNCGFEPAAGQQESTAETGEISAKRELTNFRELQQEEFKELHALRSKKERTVVKEQSLSQKQRRELLRQERQMA